MKLHMLKETLIGTHFLLQGMVFKSEIKYQGLLPN